MRAPIAGAVNVMEAPFFDPDHYRSDSNQHWRHGCPHEELAAGAFEWLQLLTHPEIWAYEGRRCARRWRRCWTPTGPRGSSTCGTTASTWRDAPESRSPAVTWNTVVRSGDTIPAPASAGRRSRSPLLEWPYEQVGFDGAPRSSASTSRAARSFRSSRASPRSRPSRRPTRSWRDRRAAPPGARPAGRVRSPRRARLPHTRRVSARGRRRPRPLLDQRGLPQRPSGRAHPLGTRSSPMTRALEVALAARTGPASGSTNSSWSGASRSSVAANCSDCSAMLRPRRRTSATCAPSELHRLSGDGPRTAFPWHDTDRDRSARTSADREACRRTRYVPRVKPITVMVTASGAPGHGGAPAGARK